MNEHDQYWLNLFVYYGRRLLRITAIFTCCWILGALFFLVGPHLDGKLFPVVSKVNVTYVNSGPYGTTLLLRGEQSRICAFKGASALVKVDGQYRKADVFYDTIEHRGGSFRPVGLQSYGAWTFHPPGDEIILVVIHDCHPFWHTVTPLFKWSKL